VQLRQYRAELRGLQMENLNLRQRHREYLERISRLKADPSEVERIARERYNFARPGDIIVNLQD
jgi:cell division protein FtsB